MTLKTTDFLHDVKTCFNHLLGYCDIVSSDLENEGLQSLVFEAKRLGTRLEDLRRLVLDQISAVGHSGDFQDTQYPLVAHKFDDALSSLDDSIRSLLSSVERELPSSATDVAQIRVLLGTLDSTLRRGPQASLTRPSTVRGARFPAKVLVVDDNLAFHRVISFQLSTIGHSAYCVGSGKEALDFLKHNAVDLILLDLLMPEMSGQGFLRILKENPELAAIPVIMISALGSSESIADCLELGAEDFLPKDFDPLVFRARLDSSMEKKRLSEKTAGMVKALVKSQELLRSELADAGKYIVSQLPRPLRGDFSADLVVLPSAELGGDFASYHWLDPSHLALYLVDVSGHGIRSALLSVSISNLVRNQALLDAEFARPDTVLNALNRSFAPATDSHELDLFAFWYGVIDLENSVLNYASGGLPPACVVRGNKTLETLHYGDLILGASRDYEYDVHSVALEKGDRVYVYSDGLYELNDRFDRCFGLKALHETLREIEPDPGLTVLLNKILDRCGRDSFEDDVSLISARL